MSINGFKAAVQSSSDGAAQDLICKKGFAVSALSRGYDHKDAFEPAQAATVPPSDADEFGAWLKYEGSAPIPAARANAVSEEELPTSWYKYETKPIASLTASELRRAKAFPHLNGTTEAVHADAAAPIAPPSAVETTPAEEPSQGARGGREDPGTGTETETGTKAETFDLLPNAQRGRQTGEERASSARIFTSAGRSELWAAEASRSGADASAVGRAAQVSHEREVERELGDGAPDPDELGRAFRSWDSKGDS